MTELEVEAFTKDGSNWVTWGRNKTETAPLKAGQDDDVYGFVDDEIVYILAVNPRIGYVGLEAFDAGSPIGEVFLQFPQEIREYLGKRGLEQRPLTMATKLATVLHGA